MMCAPARWKKPLLSPKCKQQKCILHAHNQADETLILLAGGAAFFDWGVGLVDMLHSLRAQANHVPMPKKARGVVAENMMYCDPKSGIIQTQCMMRCVCTSCKCIPAVHILWFQSQ